MTEVDLFLTRLCRIGARTGPRRFPRKRQDREILMKSIVLSLDSAKASGLLGSDWVFSLKGVGQTSGRHLRVFPVENGPGVISLPTCLRASMKLWRTGELDDRFRIGAAASLRRPSRSAGPALTVHRLA